MEAKNYLISLKCQTICAAYKRVGDLVYEQTPQLCRTVTITCISLKEDNILGLCGCCGFFFPLV